MARQFSQDINADEIGVGVWIRANDEYWVSLGFDGQPNLYVFRTDTAEELVRKLQLAIESARKMESDWLDAQ